ncbi:hypothetical protein CF327_g7557 [Tilletia walkeri]|nr:hypothetical protein CF327_g7557 [Tilletia walkeri]
MSSRQSLSRPMITQLPSEWSTSTAATKECQPDLLQSGDDEPPHQGPRFRIILLALLSAMIMVATLGILGAILVLYIFFQNTWQWTRKEDMLGRFEITTGAEATQILLFSSIATKVAGWMVAPIMSISAISCAAAFLGDQRKAKPTPAQLSMGISVLGGANIMTLLKGMGMLFGFTTSAKRHAHSTKLSTFVRRSILLLFWLTILEALLAGADFALHKTTKATFEAPRRTNAIPTPDEMAFSRVINRKFCGDDTFCHLFEEARQNARGTEPPARQTLSNSSINSVAWLQDSTAIMVSSQIPSFSYDADSIGITVGCESITRQSCPNNDWSDDDAYQGYAQAREVTFECAPGPIPYNATLLARRQRAFGRALHHVNGVLAPDGGILSYPAGPEDTKGAPFYVGFVAQSWAYIPPGAVEEKPQFYKDTGFYYGSDSFGTFNALRCTLTPKDIRYHFDAPSKRYTTIKERKFSVEDTGIFSITAHKWLMDAATAADGVGYASGRGGEYEAAFSRFYARSLVAGVSLSITASTEGVTIGDSFGQGTTLNVIVFGVYLGSLAVLM